MQRAVWALILIMTGRSALAQSAPVGSSPQSAQTKVAKELQLQDTEGALRTYHALTEADPRNAQAWTGMGVLLYGAGRAAEAETALNRALTLDNKNPHAELFRALSEADLQQCSKASLVLRRMFDQEAVGKLQRLVGMTLLGCMTQAADAGPALQLVNQLKQSYPGDPDVLYEASELYMRMWSETANELITTHPDSYRVHQLAAEVNESKGNYAQAIRQYRTALTENPKLTQMHYRIGQLLLQSGDADANDKAMVEFRAELAVNPQSTMSQLAMGEIERHNGHLDDAATDYAAALKLEPGLPAALTGMAQTDLAKRQPEAAQTELLQLLAVHPEDAQGHYVMMLTYRQQGKLSEAAAEMAVFQRLHQGSEKRFQERLDSLLNGTNPTTSPTVSGALVP